MTLLFLEQFHLEKSTTYDWVNTQCHQTEYLRSKFYCLVNKGSYMYMCIPSLIRNTGSKAPMYSIMCTCTVHMYKWRSGVNDYWNRKERQFHSTPVYIHIPFKSECVWIYACLYATTFYIHTHTHTHILTYLTKSNLKTFSMALRSNKDQ